MSDAEPPEVPGITALVRVSGGGIGQLYRGRQDPTGRGVVVKILPTPFDRRSRAQFDSERQRISALRHLPAVLPVDQVGALADGRPYLVSELCTDSIAESVRRGEQYPPERVIALGRELADALAHAHAVDVVHGAVSPENVLFRRTGQVALSDFGLALRQSYPADPGDGGEFAAPETLRDGELTVRSDLYGLGATLYAVLTGRPPFPSRVGEHPSERILRVISQPAPPVDPTLAPPELIELLAGLLATDPADRPGDATVVAQRFDRIQAGPPTPPTAPVPAAAPEPAPPSGTAPDPPADGSTDWSGLLDDVLFDTEPVDETERRGGRPPTAMAHRTRRRLGLWAAVIGGVVVLVILAALAGRLTGGDSHPTQNATVAASPPTVSSAGRPQAPAPAVRLTAAHDHGDAVELVWSGPTDLSYAVVVAESGQPNQVVLAHHARRMRVQVHPGRQYCFLIQATNGQHIIETDPRGIRGAVCHS